MTHSPAASQATRGVSSRWGQKRVPARPWTHQGPLLEKWPSVLMVDFYDSSNGRSFHVGYRE